MKESRIERKIREYAESKACLYRKFTSPNLRAVQDDIIITPHGVTGFLEIKKPGGKVHSKQTRDRERLQRMGVPVDITDSVEKGKLFVDYLLTLEITECTGS